MEDKIKSVENLLDRYYGSEDPFEQTDLAISIIQGPLGFLIQQAKRVQELEEHNQRYRQALEELDVLAVSYDADERALEPYKVVEVTSKALEGATE